MSEDTAVAERQDESSASGWELVGPVDPDRFVLVDDLVALVMEYCTSRTLMSMRLVCRRWVANRAWNWDFTMALMKERRREGRPIPLHQAVAEAQQFSFDVLIDTAFLADDRVQAIVVQENQRYFPLLGYRAKRLVGDPPHYVQVTGPYRGEVVSPHGACTGDLTWAEGSWKIIVNDQTDADGWQYAVGFRTAFGKNRRLFVRRRQWLRFVMTPADVHR
jgi:hypothetical protein